MGVQMTNILVTLIISGLSTIVWGLFFFIIKKHDHKISAIESRFSTHLEKNCHLHSIEIANHGMSLLNLEKKLWDEDKLEREVKKAVLSALNEWKLEELQEKLDKKKKSKKGSE